MVCATSAHAAFDKAGHWLDVDIRRVDVDAGYRADVDAMADAVDDGTVLVVASAPAYPQGVVDPVPELAALADERGILCHVDACLGGFVLPFLGRLGLCDRRWDLSVPGVTSLSADLHKYGYAAKGVSVILYRTRELARYQPFVTSNWLGGLYGSPALAGTRPAGPIAAAWAVLHHLGWEGYLRLAGDAHRAATALRAAVEDTPGLAVRGEPDATVLAFGADGTDDGVDAFALGDELGRRGGWFFDRQTPPDSLHATVHAGHRAVMDQLVADLGPAVAAVRSGEAVATGPDGRLRERLRGGGPWPRRDGDTAPGGAPAPGTPTGPVPTSGSDGPGPRTGPAGPDRWGPWRPSRWPPSCSCSTSPWSTSPCPTSSSRSGPRSRTCSGWSTSTP